MHNALSGPEGEKSTQEQPLPSDGKKSPAVWETQVRSLGWEDPLEEGMATQCCILAWRIRTDREAWLAPVHGVTKSLT